MKAAIFDLDGTITLTQQLHMQAYATVFKKFGVPHPAEQDFYFAGIGGDYTFKTIFEKYGVKEYDLEECKAEKRRVYSELLKKAKIEVVPGVKEFLDMLRAKYMPYALASGNRREFIDHTLQAVSLLDYFPIIITNHDVKHGKPDPEIFLVAAQKLGIAPKDCVVFEDAWSGVTASKKAGMYCVGLTTLVPEEFLKQAGADLVVKNFKDPRLKTLFP